MFQFPKIGGKTTETFLNCICQLQKKPTPSLENFAPYIFRLSCVPKTRIVVDLQALGEEIGDVGSGSAVGGDLLHQRWTIHYDDLFGTPLSLNRETLKSQNELVITGQESEECPSVLPSSTLHFTRYGASVKGKSIASTFKGLLSIWGNSTS